jgi:hypothetical protein
LVIGISGSSNGYYYSINGGANWTLVSITAPQSLSWNGKRFLFGIQTVDIRYVTNPTAAPVSITNPTGAQLFTSVFGFGTAVWPTLGSVYVDSALTTSSTSGLNTNNQLDIYSDTYFNNGYNNMAVTVKSTQIP